MTSPITTHILDLSLGKPAAGVAVTLSRLDGATWTELGSGLTDPDGRLRDLIPDATLTPGDYRLDFATAAYLTAVSHTVFYPTVVLHFRVDDPTAHYHVPLLLSPFGYSTYRGS